MGSKIITFILESALWLQPVVMYLLVRMMEPGKDSSEMAMLFLLSFLPSFAIGISGMKQKELKKDSEHDRAANPPVAEELLRKKPEDGNFLLGKNHGKYVCFSSEEDGHVLIIGGSGSGKSSTVIIPSLLINQSVPKMVVDIKGELSAKASKYGDEKTKIFNPQDRVQGYGYDPFYLLKNHNSQQEIFECMQNIVFSLIPQRNVKDPFWQNSARAYLIGTLIYFYKQGYKDLVSIIDEILSRSPQDLITEILENAVPGSNERKMLVQFQTLAEETLGGIVGEVNNAIVLFATDEDIRHAFRDNSRKVNPQMINEGFSIFLKIQEHKLSAYFNVLQLIINQTLTEMEKRPEDSKSCFLVLDELPRILSSGKLERLLDASKTLRSRHVHLVLVVQSLEALMTAYSENEALDLLGNCAYKIILEASSKKTEDLVVNWAGKYKERRLSVAGGGNNQRTTTSYEDKDILLPSDMMKLVQAKELVLISPYGYAKIKKCPYYSDKFFKPIADEIKNHNNSILEMQKAPFSS